eukprot:CAMPEP_0201554086 /NCGR_PEP_ID=MMETSP0173_2-20130828/37582_1 /ASSEMBLY_ACC=CAM_ASM_000268 /TAXON_ID=218659 /ORGANISM="Vexillifera sp., Strain DIVA3 564/2" /LENGTH=270 /DNA_ID=CAMNT_0047965241 /DNA_START=57 /DNA_END=866 /DNA_ORIENTATION=-
MFYSSSNKTTSSGLPFINSNRVREETPLQRAKFIANVYSLLAIEIAFTFALIFAIRFVHDSETSSFQLTQIAEIQLNNEGVIQQEAQLHEKIERLEDKQSAQQVVELTSFGTTLFYTSVIGSFITLIALLVFKQVETWNMVLLNAFVLCEGVMLGVALVDVDQEIIQQALLSTIGIFAALTSYARASYSDPEQFSFLRSFLYTAVGVLFWNALIGYFIAPNMAQMISVYLGSLVFCAYIVIDTYRLQETLSVDQTIEAVIALYLDFLNLF